MTRGLAKVSFSEIDRLEAADTCTEPPSLNAAAPDWDTLLAAAATGATEGWEALGFGVGVPVDGAAESLGLGCDVDRAGAFGVSPLGSSGSSLSVPDGSPEVSGVFLSTESSPVPELSAGGPPLFGVLDGLASSAGAVSPRSSRFTFSMLVVALGLPAPMTRDSTGRFSPADSVPPPALPVYKETLTRPVKYTLVTTRSSE